MGNPQLENGYARIANELLEALARIRVPGEATQILWVVVRKTYGFGKKADSIALSQFVAATGLSKPAVSRAIKKLLEINIIKKDNGGIVTYSVNKDFTSWKPLSKKIIVIKKDNQHYRKRVPQKKLVQKKEKHIVHFEKDFNEAWLVYPRKEGRIAALESYTARRREKVSAIDLLEATRKFAARMEREGRERRHIKLGSTFYGPKGFWAEESSLIEPDTSKPGIPPFMTMEEIDAWPPEDPF